MPEEASVCRETKRDVYFQLGRFVLWFTTSNGLFEESDDVGGRIHTHTVYDIHCPVEGSYYIVTAQGRVLAEPGKLVMIAPGVYHQTEHNPKCSSVKRCGFKLSFLHRLGEDPLLYPENGHDVASASTFAAVTHVAVIEDTFSCTEQLRVLRNEFARNEVGYYQRVQGLLAALVVDLVRELRKAGQVQAYPPELLQDTRREKIEEYFNLHFSGAAHQEELAEQMHLSVRQLNRVLNELYGMSFKEKLLHTRIAVAKNWLSTTDKTVGEIAEICGYEFESRLSHAFKHLTAMTPREFRKAKAAAPLRGQGPE